MLVEIAEAVRAQVSLGRSGRFLPYRALGTIAPFQGHGDFNRKSGDMVHEAKRVLVVEDNQVMADVIRFNLERAGFSVSVASDGHEALQFIQTQRFDFVITDYQMPQMSGDEFCRRLRQHQWHAEVPVLMCSAKGLELDMQSLQEELRIDKILFKPFSPRELVDFVRATLQRDPAGV